MADEYVIIEKSSLNNIGDTVRSATGSTDSIIGTNLSNEVAVAISTAGTQSDWEQTDSTAKDYIKNKPFYEDAESATIKKIDYKFMPDEVAMVPSDEEMILTLNELGIIDPAFSTDGAIYTDTNNDIYVL